MTPEEITEYIFSELSKNISEPMQFGTNYSKRLIASANCLFFELSTKQEWIEHKGKYWQVKFMEKAGEASKETMDKLLIEVIKSWE